MIIGSATANIDDNLEKANDAKDTAIVANNGVKDINSDNKLTPNEKLSLKRLYDSDVLKHDFDVKQLTSMSLPTADIDLALSNLTSFTAKYFVNMDITEEVDRQALNKVFNNFENADKAVEGLFNDAVQQVADDAKKAGDDAKEVGEKAQEAGEAAKQAAGQAQADATQAKADAATAQQKAQSSIDQLNAHLPDIDTALSTANLVKQDVTKLSSTTEQYHNEYTTGIQNVVKTIDDITVGGTNLIENSKFDDNMNGWRIWCPQGMGTSTVQINPTGGGGDWPRQAIYSAKIINTEADKNNQFGIAQDNVPVEPSTEYVLQLFNDGSDPITLQHGNGTGDPYVFQAISGHKAVWKFKTPASTYTTNIYIGFDSGQSGTAWISLTKLEKGNKPTDWSLSPFDTATSTEIDQLNNAIRLKADSSDVTSQINVAIQGVQTDVTNKVSDLTTKVSQTDSAWRASVSTIGITNMVYNGGFAHGVDGWNTNNGKWAWSNQAPDQVQGNNAIQAIFTGLTTDTWNNAASRPFLVCPGQKMSIGAIVTPWILDSDPNKGFGINLEFFASKDGTGTRNNYHPEQWVYTTGRQQLKVENITVPDGANSAVVRLFIQRNGGANFTCVQANMTPTLPQFIDGFATATDITASINNINLKVSNSDGSSSQVNINNDTILLDANKINFNGNTSIQNGTINTAKIANAAIGTAQIADAAINNAKIANASIDDAKINSLNGNKIVAGSITSKQLNANDIIANVINGKTINGITITTPNLQLGTNGTLTEDWTLNQATSLFNPKKGSGTMTLTKGILATEGTLSRWWSDDGGYWYGIGNDGSKIKNGSNQVGDNYGAGYAQHNIFDSKGNTLLRTYMDATGLYMNSGGTSNVNTVLTQQGLTTTNVTALGDINGASLTTSGWINAGIGSGNGIRIGFRTIQSHNTQDLYFNGDDNKQSVTLHAKSIIQSSQLSRKKDIKPLDPDYAMKVIRESDMYGYRYNEEAPTEPLHYSGIIDDVNGTPQYKMPEEFISEDRTGRNDGNTVAFLVEALKQADKRIGILEGMMNHD
ncbi:hypothetical protein [Pediococcus pentosaceus]|uniref:Peptidase S74 domain-containing protein n=1 Tax=Pediococcus pentosaceus TaxID=1255 RepID=A0ABD7X6I0_PEDPE|nr:hypothetical protein [Pediococcus pentosaceus]WEA57320.1 hypothetical protein PWB86_00070 [Pediococcus pentosaceus]